MASSSRRLFGQGFGVLMAAAKTSSATTTAAAAGGIAKRTTGLTKPLPVTPALGRFLGGVSESSRADALKKVWEHIKLHNLQKPSNRKEIFCDAKLKTIFDGMEQVRFTEISKFLSLHFVKATK